MKARTEPVPRGPFGLSAMGVFLIFAAVMATLAGVTLVWPGTVLQRMWTLNPRAYERITPFGKVAGIAFLLLGMVLSIAAIGWRRRTLWGWRLAVIVIAAQVLGDGVNICLGRFVEGGIGATVSGALLFYLLRDRVRSAFGHGRSR